MMKVKTTSNHLPQKNINQYFMFWKKQTTMKDDKPHESLANQMAAAET